MADYDLKYAGQQIDALLDAADELKTNGFIYKGVATPSTNPGTPTERVAYLASEPGTYTNFGGIVIASGLYSLTYVSGTWTGTQMQAGSDIEVVQTTGDSTTDVMSQKAVTEELEVHGDNLIDMSVMGADSAGTSYLTATKDAANNGVVFNVVVHSSSRSFGRIYQMHLVEGKTYRLSFEYLNTAYQTSPSFRNSSNTFIASDISSVMMPVNNEYKTWECTFVAPANAYYLAFASLANGSANTSLTIKNFSCVETSSLKESIAELNDKIEKAGILGNYELYQGTINNGQILPDTKRLYTNIIKTPCYIKARDGYHIAGITRYGDNSRNIFLGSDWDITLNERNVNDFGYCSFVITKGNSSQDITPDEDCIELFYNMLLYSGYEIVSVAKNMEILQNANFDMPFLGYGRKVISRPTDTYTHAASVDITSDYMFISYQSSAYKTVESFVNNAMTLYVLKLSDASVRYIDMFNDRSLEKIDGNVISKVYNQSVAVLNNQKILMRTGCNMDGKWQLIGRTYDANLNELSAPFVEKLSYNGMTVDFTLSNWWSMCNTLYGTSLSDIARTDSNEIAGICRSGNYYYTVHAFYHRTNEVIPTVLLKSLDAITWEPVACLTKTHVNSETAITALNNKLYIAFRNNNNGTFYMVTDMDGNVLQDWTSTGGGISSRPSIASAGGKIYIAYNHATGNSKHFGRNGLTIAEINQTSYELTTFKTWKSNNGYNYFAITPTINQNLIIANVEDFRGYNYANNQNATTDINIAEIELL